MKKKGTILALVSLMFVGLQTVASGYPLPAKFKMKFANVEVFQPSTPFPVAAPDGVEDNWGIANITDIFDNADPLAPAIWTEGDAGEHLRLIFWGLDIASWPSDPGPFVTEAATSTAAGVAIPFAGADLWLWDEEDMGASYLGFSTISTPAGRLGFNDYPTVTPHPTTPGSIPVKQVSLEFKPGINASPTVLTNGTTFGTGIPPTGHGTGYFDVIPGSGPIASVIDTNSFPTLFGGKDLFFEFNFRTPGIDGFDLLSEDPVLGATPEPNTILFFGIGLIGLGAFVRRRIAR